MTGVDDGPRFVDPDTGHEWVLHLSAEEVDVSDTALLAALADLHGDDGARRVLDRARWYDAEGSA